MIKKREEKLLKLCQKYHLTLALAESCTGGGLAARLTKIPGASHYFAGAIVSYQDRAKIHLLNVSEQLLKHHGAVSQEVANKMLIGALEQFSADIAIAITGIAGPKGGTLKTPVGTVYIALGGKNFPPKTVRLQLEGSRQLIIENAIEQALLHLIEWIEDNYRRV